MWFRGDYWTMVIVTYPMRTTIFRNNDMSFILDIEHLQCESHGSEYAEA